MPGCVSPYTTTQKCRFSGIAMHMDFTYRNQLFMFFEKKKKQLFKWRFWPPDCLGVWMGIWYLLSLECGSSVWTYNPSPEHLMTSTGTQSKEHHLFQYLRNHWFYWADEEMVCESLTGHPSVDASKINIDYTQSSPYVLTLQLHSWVRSSSTFCLSR